MEKIMSKPEWGIKRLCPSCGIKYYDFNKEIIKCPKCEFEFDPDLLLKSRKGRGVTSKIEEENVSSNVKEENETLEESVDAINNEQILEIDESDVASEINNDNMDVGLDESIENNEINIIEDENDNEENNFSIEIEEDESDKNEN